MSPISRRSFLALSSLAGVSAMAQMPRLDVVDEFRFLFITDTHIQPELNAAQGCAAAFRKAAQEHADFAIQGGDHIFDGINVPLSRSRSLYNLYTQTEQQLGLRVYHTIGNHDVLGINAGSGVPMNDPEYAKNYFVQHIGPLHQSFDHRGVHFVILDSIGVTPGRGYFGYVDPAQMAWLAADLAAIPKGTPVVVVSHIPLVTAYYTFAPPTAVPATGRTLTVNNATAVIALLEQHNVIGVLQGHTHIQETVVWRGIPYYTCGAVCGAWWKGPEMGIPEGYTVCTVRNGVLSLEYVTYGWNAAVNG